MNEVQNGTGEKKICPCPHHKMIPILGIILGVVFLLEALNIFSMRFAHIVWPILLIIAAGMKLNEGKCKCC